jgi:hypothetical protein
MDLVGSAIESDFAEKMENSHRADNYYYGFQNVFVGAVWYGRLPF